MQLIIDFLIASMTPLIGAIATGIAYQQHRTNRFRLRHELYERRIRIYKIVIEFVSDIVRSGTAEYPKVTKFYSEASEAVFLFPSPIQTHIDLLYGNAIDLAYSQEQLYPSDKSKGVEGEERGRVAGKKGELVKWFNKQLPETKALFRIHMNLDA